MSTNQPIKVGLLKQSELEEAGRIVRLAFGTFLGLPDPLDFMGDRNLMAPRWRSTHVKVIAAREGGRLIGSNVVTRWGSFGFFGPLTVLPEYWDRGVAQRLLEATMTIFDRWGVRHTGLFTFPQSAKHVGLYQKFGYWPRYLTAIMTRTPEANPRHRLNLRMRQRCYRPSPKASANRPSRPAGNSPTRSIRDSIWPVRSGPYLRSAPATSC